MKVTAPFLLFVVFLTLKLCHVIDWAWLWVTAPLWGCFALTFASSIIGTVLVLVWARVDPAGYKAWQAQRALEELAKRLRAAR